MLGTGMVGQALAGSWPSSATSVTVGTRDVGATLARSEPDSLGNPPFGVWREAHQGGRAGDDDGGSRRSRADRERHERRRVDRNARVAAEDGLAGKVLVDVSNPLDASQGIPPSLFVCNTDSLGEQIQRRFPQARVVKTLKTMNCEVMVDPARCPARTTSSSAARMQMPRGRSPNYSRASAGPVSTFATSAASPQRAVPRCTSRCGSPLGSAGHGPLQHLVVRAPASSS